MVATQRALGLVKHDVGAAPRTARDPAAVITRKNGGVSAPVEEHEALLAAFEARFHRGDERSRQLLHRRPSALPLLFQVDQSDTRQNRRRHGPTSECELGVSPLLSLPPAFERWRRR